MAKPKDAPAPETPTPDEEQPATPAKRYRVGENGLAWDGHTAAPGTVRSDIPAESVGWLLKKGYITEAPDDEAPADEGAVDG